MGARSSPNMGARSSPKTWAREATRTWPHEAARSLTEGDHHAVQEQSERVYLPLENMMTITPLSNTSKRLRSRACF